MTEASIPASSAGHVKDPRVQFILAGFKQDADVRVFVFEDTGKNRAGLQYSVSADLALARRYGIATQDLPLLCRSVLEGCTQGAEQSTLVFTEQKMILHAANCKDVRRIALLKKKSRFKPPSTVSHSGWRAPMQVQIGEQITEKVGSYE